MVVGRLLKTRPKKDCTRDAVRGNKNGAQIAFRLLPKQRKGRGIRHRDIYSDRSKTRANRHGVTNSCKMMDSPETEDCINKRLLDIH